MEVVPVHASALSQIVEYFALFEGGGKSKPITWMYLDRLGLVTTGVGVLIDPIETLKVKVTFFQKNSDGSAGDTPASEDDLNKEFELVKSKTKRAADGSRTPLPGWELYQKFEPVTNLRLKGGDNTGSALRQITQIDGWMQKQFGGDYNTWPADIQVACIHMNFAGGFLDRLNAGMRKCLVEHDWLGARTFAYISGKNGDRSKYAKYNRALYVLMTNGYIIDTVRKMDMKYPTPKDYRTFYGVRSALDVSRWNRDESITTINPDDMITGGDVYKWCDAAPR